MSDNQTIGVTPAMISAARDVLIGQYAAGTTVAEVIDSDLAAVYVAMRAVASDCPVPDIVITGDMVIAALSAMSEIEDQLSPSPWWAAMQMRQVLEAALREMPLSVSPEAAPHDTTAPSSDRTGERDRGAEQRSARLSERCIEQALRPGLIRRERAQLEQVGHE